MAHAREAGPVDPSFRALSGRLKFTVRRHKSNKYSREAGVAHAREAGFPTPTALSPSLCHTHLPSSLPHTHARGAAPPPPTTLSLSVSHTHTPLPLTHTRPRSRSGRTGTWSLWRSSPSRRSKWRRTCRSLHFEPSLDALSLRSDKLMDALSLRSDKLNEYSLARAAGRARVLGQATQAARGHLLRGRVHTLNPDP